jgi:CubicO group peptidase (beta-lactamase class C family)
MTGSRFRRLPIALVLLALTSPAALGAEPPLHDLDAWTVRAMREFEVPGVALAVVHDGRVAVGRGYGVRRLGEPTPVDEHTLFGIASNTKAFTCAALATLVEEGRLAWGDPVTRHLPGFQMHDPWVTREVTVRDLITHRAGLGLGAGDLMWWPSTEFTRAEIVAGVRHLVPASSLRSRYAYNNVLYVVAGEVIAAVSGKSWDEFVRARLLGPLGMSRTTTSVGQPPTDSNVATPHIRAAGAVRPIEPGDFDNAAAAAGLNSSAADMARWLDTLLACQAAEPPAGRTCPLGRASIRELWSAQTVRGTPEPPAGLEATRANFAAYGLGFGLRDWRGRKLVVHEGALPGYYSLVALVPEERLGLVVLTSQEEAGILHAVLYHVLDAFLGAAQPPTDWIAAEKTAARADLEKAREKVAQAFATRAADSKPSLALSRYAGRWADPWYGEASIAAENGRLELTMTRTPGMVADLEHFQFDTFVARWRRLFMSDTAPADAYVAFCLGPDGAPRQMTMAPVSPATDFSFDFQDLRFTPAPSTAPAPQRAPGL